jgi:hypothetical protein
VSVDLAKALGQRVGPLVHQRTDTVAGDVGGLFVRVPPPPAAVWPLVDALAQPYGQGQPLTWLAAVPTTETPLLEKAPLVGTKVEVRASMGIQRTIGAWTDVSSQVTASPGALESIAGLLGAITAADVDRAVANELAGLGRLSGSGGQALVALQRWPGPRLIVLSGQAVGEMRDWSEYADESEDAIIVLADPYIGVNLVIATAGVALGVLAPGTIQADDPALFGVDVAHAMVYALEASPDAIRSWRSTGDSGAGGGGGGGSPLPIPPTITSVVPNVGLTTGGERVRVLGADLTGATDVVFGGAPAAIIFVSLGGTYIDCDTPPHAAGPVDVSVTTADGTDTRPNAFTYIVPPPPTIVRVTPNSGPLAGTQSVVITGTNLLGTTDVTFGADPATSFVATSQTDIIAVTPAGVAGPVDVSVTTPNGTDTLAAGYTYVDTTTPPPNPTAISPAEGLPAGGTPVIITGTDFTDATSVIFASTPASALVVANDTLITCTTPPGVLGPCNVSVSGPGGTGSLVDGFEYTATPTPPPTITSVTPDSGSTLGGETITVSGTGFTGASSVEVGAVPATGLVVVSDTELNCVTPAVPHAIRTHVTVHAPGGSTTLTHAYSYIKFIDPPVLTSINPVSGLAAGATAVVLTGTALTDASEVLFGTVPATGLTVNNDTQVHVNAPAGTAGSVVDVSITTPGGADTLVGAYTYTPLPNLTSVTPNTTQEHTQPSIRITGTGLTGATSVYVCGSLCGSVVVESDTALTCTVPNKPAMTGDVTVHTPAGRADIVGGFTYTAIVLPPVPVTLALNPNTDNIDGGAAVVVTGSDFLNASAVTIGGVAATNIVVVSATTINCTVPAHARGAVAVSVTTPSGRGPDLANGFTYTQPAPVMQSLSPSSMGLNATATIRIYGQWFTDTTNVFTDNPNVAEVASYAAPVIGADGNDYIDAVFQSHGSMSSTWVGVQTTVARCDNDLEFRTQV